MVSRALFLSFLSVLVGCSSTPKQFTITLRGEGDQRLNRDIRGKSLSVVVHVYQLKDAREFSKLTFDTLASGRPDAELLGPALLEKTDAIVVPGGNYAGTEKLLDETKFLGIVAFFRSPDPHHWRQLIDVEALKKRGLSPNGSLGLLFRVEECYIKIVDVEPVLLPGQPPKAKPECGLKPGGVSRSGLDSETSSAPLLALKKIEGGTTIHAANIGVNSLAQDASEHRQELIPLSTPYQDKHARL